MKIKLDENLPARLVPLLKKLGHQVDTVADEGLAGKPDINVWHKVTQEQRFLITQDLDFSDMRQFQPGSHPGILLVRLREPSANALQLDRFYRINGLRKKTFNTYPVHPVKITPCGKVQTVVWRKFSKVETVNRQLGLSCCKARSTPSGSRAMIVR